MRYYKNINEYGFVSSINTLNGEGEGNITAEEYEHIRELFVNLPVGKQIKDNGDSTYTYVDAPPMPDPEPTDEDYAKAGRILMGVEE